MCGRLACGLSPQEICYSCCYRRSEGNQYAVPDWKDCYNSGKTYKPSYNICPTDVAPVLLSGSHFKLNSRFISPMVFGVIPQWTKTATKYTTINCRIETIKTSKLYGTLLKKGQRCVVICNGFYEWQKQNTGKSPYFCYNEQPNGIEVDNPDTWNLKFTPESGYSGFRPLKLAALFETNSNSLEEATLSFTIITKEASSETSWIHTRVPVILKTDEQLNVWLNFEEVDADLALTYISDRSSLLFFKVSNVVNNHLNKDISCMKQEKDFAENKKIKKGSAGLLMNWLETGQKRKGDTTVSSICEKIKKEDI